MRVLLLVVLVTMHLASVSRALSCSSLLSGSANLIVDLTSLRACLRALPVNQTFNSEVAETAILSAQLHALAPYVPSTYSAILNLRNLLQLNEFDFLSNVSRAFASATDLHFTMRGPPFYDRVYVLRLLSFGSQSYVDPATNQTAQQLYISNTVTSSNYNTLLSLWQASGTSANLPSLASITATLNKAVATVNGLPALVWARQAARASGLKSDGVNFNYALQSNFFARLLNEYDVNRDVDTIVFSDGTAFTAPAMAYVSAFSAISKSYRCDLPSTAAGSVHARREENFAPQQAPQTYLGSTQLPQMISVGRVGAQDPAMREVVELIFGPSPSSAPSTSSVSVGSVTGFGSASIETTASGKKIALLRINSFLPSGDLNTAANNIYAMIRNLQTQSLGITNELAIDVSENGGGYVVLGDLVLKLLDSTYNEAFIAQGSSYLIADANQKNSLWYSAYIRSSVFSGPFKQFPYNDLNASFIYDAYRIKPYYYGQGTNPWWWQASATNYYTGNFQYFLGTSVAASTVNPFTRVRIISDGVCGSTCCHFASRLSTWGMVGAKVESIGFGSFVGDTNIPISDFCGGSVLTTSCVLSTAGLSTHPFMTMNTLREDIDFGFVDMAILKTNASTVHMQYDTPVLVTKQISDWTALTNQQRRLDLAYSDVSSARMAAGVLLSMVISVVVGVVMA